MLKSVFIPVKAPPVVFPGCELTKGSEDDERKGIADYPLANGTENHQQAAEEEEDPYTAH